MCSWWVRLCLGLLQARRLRRQMWRKASLVEASALGLVLLLKAGRRRRWWRKVQTTALAFAALQSGTREWLNVVLLLLIILVHLKRVILLAVVIRTL